MEIFLIILLMSFFVNLNCYGVAEKIHINSFKKLWDNFHTVERGVFYRSGQLKPNHLAKYIKKHGIKTVINLRGENQSCKWWKAEKCVTANLGVKFYNLRFCAQILESKNNLKKLLYLYKKAPRPILVHCLGGADRTGEAAALWVLEQQHKNKKAALKQLSIRYGYCRFKHPDKYFLVKHWCGLGES
jgi:protein tyrosine/serine phosphatase